MSSEIDFNSDHPNAYVAFTREEYDMFEDAIQKGYLNKSDLTDVLRRYYGIKPDRTGLKVVEHVKKE